MNNTSLHLEHHDLESPIFMGGSNPHVPEGNVGPSLGGSLAGPLSSPEAASASLAESSANAARERAIESPNRAIPHVSGGEAQVYKTSPDQYGNYQVGGQYNQITPAGHMKKGLGEDFSVNMSQEAGVGHYANQGERDKALRMGIESAGEGTTVSPGLKAVENIAKKSGKFGY